MCEGVYLPAVLAKASVTNLENINSQMSGQISSPVAVAVGVLGGLGIVAIIALIVLVWRYWWIKNRLNQLQKEGVYKT